MDMKTFLQQADQLAATLPPTQGPKPIVERAASSPKLRKVSELHLGKYYADHPRGESYLKNLEVIKSYDPELYAKIVTLH